MKYDWIAPRKIVFGWGRRTEVGRLAKSLGRRAFLISGSPILTAQGVMDDLQELLSAEGVESIHVETLRHEPEVADVDRLSAVLHQQQVGPGDLMIGIGGGSAIDLAKALAAMATNRESSTVKDYLENVGRNLQIREDPLPVLAMPTTAGTGAEATRNAVISSYNPPFKKSLRDDRIMPQIALVDPELSVSVPLPVAAASGMDAITQCLESYISRKAQPIPQALAAQGWKLAMSANAEAAANGTSRRTHEYMAQAALLSGMALANSGLGMVHGVAAALGVHCRVPHGVACAVMLPTALRVNRHERARELTELAAMIGQSSPDKLIATIENLCDRLLIPRRLRDVGVQPEQIPALVRDSRGSSMSGNPHELSDAELTGILEQLL